MSMKFVCDLCGATLQVQTEGNARCSGCGMEYSMEYLRQKIGKTVSNNTSTPIEKKDQKNDFSNLLSLARMELQKYNRNEAIQYCNRVLEKDYADVDARIIKIKATYEIIDKAAIIQESFDVISNENSRKKLIDELMSEFDYAQFSSGFDQNDKIAQTLNSTDTSIILCFLNKLFSNTAEKFQKLSNEICEKFEKEKNDEPGRSIQYHSTTNFVVADNHRYISDIKDILPIAKKLHSFAIDNEYNIIESTEKLYNVWIDHLNKALTFKRWYGTYDHTERYTVGTFSIYKHELKPILSKDETIQVKLLIQSVSDISKKLNEDFRSRLVNKYWEQYPDQKQALDREIAEAEKEINSLELKYEKLDCVIKYGELLDSISSLERERSLLSGMFKSKKRKELTDRILLLESKEKKLRVEVDEADKKMNANKKTLEAKLNLLKKERDGVIDL